VGNAAAEQYQADIYGELMDTIYLCDKWVEPMSYDLWSMVIHRTNWVCDNWPLPDDGVWEMRSQRQHFVFSKVMNWVALDRAIKIAESRSLPGDIQRWTAERNKIYEEIMTKGWSAERQAFTMYYGSDMLDAAVLIMPLVGFISATDSRWLTTLDAILKRPRDGGLTVDGLVYRYQTTTNVDGLTGEEGTFNLCSFWLVEALARAGRRFPERLVQARLIFERVLGYANHLGLYAEETGPQGEALGNFPQAFTHLALISAAYNLNRALCGEELHTH